MTPACYGTDAGVRVTIQGRVAFCFDGSVSMAEMREWEPQRIYEYFCGIADAIRAAKGDKA